MRARELNKKIEIRIYDAENSTSFEEEFSQLIRQVDDRNKMIKKMEKALIGLVELAEFTGIADSDPSDYLTALAVIKESKCI